MAFPRFASKSSLRKTGISWGASIPIRTLPREISTTVNTMLLFMIMLSLSFLLRINMRIFLESLEMNQKSILTFKTKKGNKKYLLPFFYFRTNSLKKTLYANSDGCHISPSSTIASSTHDIRPRALRVKKSPSRSSICSI